MITTVGIDVGSTYTKVALLQDLKLIGTAMRPTGYKLGEAARDAFRLALEAADLDEDAVDYCISTGYGRFQVPFRDTQVTDLTAHARGAKWLFPKTRTVLDIGGQTMKATRIDAAGKVQSFRLNDKCAAGTGAFLEKTARYLGYSTKELGPLAETSKSPVSISGVCAVFAESEVINHVSNGVAPADIIRGAMESLVKRSLQLLRRVRMQPEVTLVGGILRFPAMVDILSPQVEGGVNVPRGAKAQLNGAIGAAYLGQRRIRKKRGLALDEAAVSGVVSE